MAPTPAAAAVALPPSAMTVDPSVLNYWKERLANLPFPQLPTDYPRPVKQQVKYKYILTN